MKRIIPISILLLLACSGFGLEFRKTSWMMSRDEVIASEAGRMISERSVSRQEHIVFQTIVCGFTATVTYVLEDNKLLSAFYTFKKDLDRRAFDAVRQELAAQNGKPSFEKKDLAGWRLERTEIALSHLADGTSCASYWEKAYFASINNLKSAGNAR